MLKYILLVLLLIVAGFMANVRLAPSDPAAWNTDPLAASLPMTNGWLIRQRVAMPLRRSWLWMQLQL